MTMTFVQSDTLTHVLKFEGAQKRRWCEKFMAFIRSGFFLSFSYFPLVNGKTVFLTRDIMDLLK